jgi:hypothetical protein
VLRTRQDARWHECLIGSCAKRSRSSDSTHDAPGIAALRFQSPYVRLGSILLKKASSISTNHDSVFLKLSATGDGHDGSPDGRSEPAVLPFQTSKNRFQRIISYAGSIQSSRGCWIDLREKLAPFYSDIGRPSIDPELMIRMLIVGYCYGIRFERKLCEEVVTSGDAWSRFFV